MRAFPAVLGGTLLTLSFAFGTPTTVAAIETPAATSVVATTLFPNLTYTLSDSGRSYLGNGPGGTQVVDRDAGTSTPTNGRVLSGDGSRTFDGTTVRTVSGAVVGSFPAVPAGWTPQILGSHIDLDTAGSVAAIEAFNPVTLAQSVFVGVPGGATVADLSHGLSATTLNTGVTDAALSGNGRFVAVVHQDFVVGCTVASGVTCVLEVLRIDLTTGEAEVVGLTPNGSKSRGIERAPRISDDGRFVAFISDATDLVSGITTTADRIYRRDMVTGNVVLVADRLATNGVNVELDMTGNGQRVAFNRAAANGGTNVYVADLGAGTSLPLVVSDESGTPSCNRDPVISANGESVLLWNCGSTIVAPPVPGPTVGALLLAAMPPMRPDLGYTGVTPGRIYDSRNGEDDAVPNLAAGATVHVAVAGHGGLPADAAAAVLNVTVTNPAAGGYVTVWPCDSERPTASNLNYVAGQTIPNAVVTALAADGSACLFTQSAADLVVDAQGSFGPTSSYGAVSPIRIVDTRASEDDRTPPSLAAGSVFEIDIPALVDIPDSTSAVSLNVTVTKASAAGYLTVYPCGTPAPTASNLNYRKGQATPNLVVSRLGTDGKVCVFAQQRLDVVVDLNGFFADGSGLNGFTPTRLYDSRNGESDIIPNVRAGTVVRVPVTGRPGVAPGFTAVLNVTVTNPTRDGFVTVWPCDVPRPLASNLNFSAGLTIPNAVISKLAADGSICLFSTAPTDLIVDAGSTIET